MKLKRLVEKLNRAEFEHNLDKTKKLWLKILKKSFKHKHTENVQ